VKPSWRPTAADVSAPKKFLSDVRRACGGGCREGLLTTVPLSSSIPLNWHRNEPLLPATHTAVDLCIVLTITVIIIIKLVRFLSRDAYIHSAIYAVETCPSLRLCVCLTLALYWKKLNFWQSTMHTTSWAYIVLSNQISWWNSNGITLKRNLVHVR